MSTSQRQPFEAAPTKDSQHSSSARGSNNNNNNNNDYKDAADDATNDYFEFMHNTTRKGGGKHAGDTDDERDDFLMRIMDGTCQGIFSTDDTNCRSMLPACQARIEEQLDLLTHCRQPLGFLSFFQEHNGLDSRGEMGVEVLPAGVYAVPTFCEYCGAKDVRDCDPLHCPRPALYFQKKRPPFCRPNPTLWDTHTDHAIEKVPPRVVVEQQPAVIPLPSREVTATPTSWMTGFFRGNEKVAQHVTTNKK